MHRFNRARSFLHRTDRNRRQHGIEQLECRTLLNATLTATPPPVYAVVNSAPTSISLSSYITDSNVPGDFVLMQTNQGQIPIALSNDSAVSQTVKNFENYVTSAEYDNTFFHRVETTAQTAPNSYGIVQGGSYSTSFDQIKDLTAQPLPLQYKLLNKAGTIAMARGQQQDSATSGFFFNVVDNSTAFDQSNGGGYAVFGTVIYNGMDTINKIYSLPQTGLTTNDGQQQTNVPVLNGSSPPTPSNLVVIQSATLTSPLTWGASTDNNQLVTLTLATDGTLTLNYVPGATGTAHIDVTASDLAQPTPDIVNTSFTVTVTALPTTPVTLGQGGARIVRFTDPNGVAGTARLAGPGTATLTFIGAGVSASTSRGGVETVTGTPQSVSISTTGTSTGSALNIAGAVSLAGISTDASIGSISAARASLVGDLSVGGTIGTINLASASLGTITISGAGRSSALRIGSAANESVNAAGTIGSINSGSWTSGGALSAATINRIAVTHEFNADIAATTLGRVVAGSITQSGWNVSGNVGGISAGSIIGLSLNAGVIGPITDRGAAQDDEIISSGSIGAVSARSMIRTHINAAVSSELNGLATGFTGNATIASITVGRGGFGDSAINAQTLRHVNLGTLSSGNNGTAFGVTSADIVLLTATIDGKRLVLRRASSQSDVTAALSKAGITPTDLVIRIVS